MQVICGLWLACRWSSRAAAFCDSFVLLPILAPSDFNGEDYYYCSIYDVSCSVSKIALEQYLIYQGQLGRLCRRLGIFPNVNACMPGETVRLKYFFPQSSKRAMWYIYTVPIMILPR